MANYVKFMRGTPEAYAKLPQKNDDTLYFIFEQDKSKGILYLGNKVIAGNGSGEGGSVTALKDLTDVQLNASLKDKEVLSYDSKKKKWINTSTDSLISIFQGATEIEPGRAGLVPIPQAGDLNKFLRSDGSWATISASECQVFIVDKNSGETDQEVIDRATSGIVINSGDCIIIKDTIVKDIVQNTAYIYNGAQWTAMSGNYNAKDVFFDSNLVFTEDVGTIVIPESGNTTVETKGKNVEDVLKLLFAQAKNPEITQPKVKTLTAPKNTSYEVGTTVIPSFEASFDPGLYTYGPPTGIIPTAWNVQDSTGHKLDNLMSDITSKGDFPEVLVEDNTNYTIAVSCDYTNGSIPFNNLKETRQELQIKAGTTAVKQTNAIKGFRNFFYGTDNTLTEINSAFVRKLTKGGSYTSSKTIYFDASDKEHVSRFIIAIPASVENAGIKKAIITTSMNSDVTTEYCEQELTVDVEGNNGYQAIPYKVWIYQPASIANTERHTVTLK